MRESRKNSNVNCPTQVKKIIEENVDAEDMTREELVDFVSDLEHNDKEIEMYFNTIGVKADIAVTLALSLVAFFFGMCGYMLSYTIGYDDSPNLLVVSFCFTFVIFACVYVILKTMRVIWDV